MYLVGLTFSGHFGPSPVRAVDRDLRLGQSGAGGARPSGQLRGLQGKAAATRMPRELVPVAAVTLRTLTFHSPQRGLAALGRRPGEPSLLERLTLLGHN